MNRDPLNYIGKQIMDELKADNVTYGYACINKLRRFFGPTLTENILSVDPYGIDSRHEKGCVRRYGAVSDTFIPHHLCSCHSHGREQL